MSFNAPPGPERPTLFDNPPSHETPTPSTSPPAAAAGRPPPPAVRRAALYARVSTDDRGQDPETQLRLLREYADRRGFAVAAEFVDFASGTRNDRPQYKKLMAAARELKVAYGTAWNHAKALGR